MLKTLKLVKREEKGFTLIELLAVIVILAIIAVIAVPLIGNIISKSKTDADLATAKQVYEAARLYAVGEGDGTMTQTITIAQLQAGKYLESPIYLPSTKAEITGGSVNLNAGLSAAFVSLTIDGETNPRTFTREQVMGQQ